MRTTVLIFYANSSSLEQLDLSKEGQEIRRNLEKALPNDIDVITVDNVTVEDFIKELDTEEKHIEILHFAGHAGDQILHFSDQPVKAEAIANKIKSKNGTIKLVFLNGCATYDMVHFFHEAGVPFVIATSRIVQDKKATEVALQFYEYLLNKKSLNKAIQEIQNNADLGAYTTLKIHRGVVAKKAKVDAEFEWGLYVKAPPVPDDYEFLKVKDEQEEAFNFDLKTFLSDLAVAIADKEKEVHELFRSELKINKLKKTLLKTLPYPIGRRVQAIIAYSKDEGPVQDLGILKELTFFFETLLQLTFIYLLAKLGEEKEELLKDKPKNYQLFVNYFKRNLTEVSPAENAEAILLVWNWLEGLEIDSLVHFNQDFITALKSEDFKRYFQFFHKVKQRIRNNNFRDWELNQNCRQAYTFFMQFFPHFSFLQEYKMVSVKKIKVFASRYLAEDYSNVMNVFQELKVTTKEDTEEDVCQTIMDKSILAYYKPESNYEDSLNLFPYLIDRNSFLNADEQFADGLSVRDVFDIHILSGIYISDESGTECFHYISIHNPEQVWAFDVNAMTNKLKYIGQREDKGKYTFFEFKEYLKSYTEHFFEKN